MIIRIEKSGGSFRGAGLYYLHDKQPEAERADKSIPNELKPKTDERVWFAHTRNCASLDAKQALDQMWHVAESQQWLKREAGGRTCGRVCSEPVKTISIAWHRDDRPTPDHMADAADAYLKHMGWDGHQAVYVGHRDTEHFHIHIILNRVDHETGRTLDDGFERRRAQEFALDYEKEHGRLWCVERELNAASREKREPELDMAVRQSGPDKTPANEPIPHNVIEIMRPYQKLHEAHEKAALDASLEAERGTLKAGQRAEREAWFRDGKDLFRQTRHAVYDAVRAEFRDEWRDLYRDRAEATRTAEAHSGSAMDRAFHFAREGEWEKALAAFGDRDAVRDDVAKEMAERLAALKAEQTAAIRERQEAAMTALRQERDAGYKELLARQREERAAMKASHVQGQSAEFVLDSRQARETDREAAPVANDNRQAAAVAQERETAEPRQTAPEPARTADGPQPVNPPFAAALDKLDSVKDAALDAARDDRSTLLAEAEPPRDRERSAEPVKSAADLAAGAIGSVADYLADQMAEMLAPTPPEVREQRAKEEVKREEEKREAEPAEQTPWQRHIEAVIREAQRMEEEKRSRDYWTERDRNKEWERER